MGYYTRYDLEIVETDNHEVDHKENLLNLERYKYLFDDEIKWYDHEESLISYSKQYPTTIFKLIGEGEENGDLWHKYFVNGGMQVCKGIISYPVMDISKFD